MATLGQFPLSHSCANADSLGKPFSTGQKSPGSVHYSAESAGQGMRANNQCPMNQNPAVGNFTAETQRGEAATKRNGPLHRRGGKSAEVSEQAISVSFPPLRCIGPDRNPCGARGLGRIAIERPGGPGR